MRNPGLEDRIRAGLLEGYVLPILPRHRVYVFDLSLSNGGERFAENFKRTWKRLPLGPRRRILAAWKCGDSGTIGRTTVLVSPQIELVDGWSGRRDAVGAAGANGHLLRFFAPDIRRMPDNLVEDLIAHELAHVYQGALRMLDWDETDELQVAVDEQEADILMEEWGFDADALDDWLNDQGLTAHESLSAE